MARTGVYRVSALAYYVVMEHSTIFTGIGDVDTRSFHRHSRDRFSVFIRVQQARKASSG